MESEKENLETVKESQTITAIQRLWNKRIFGAKEYFIFIISMLLLANLAILLNILFLRQFLGFLFLTILPGLLIIQILKLDKLEFIEKFILSWGISISFLMFFGLLINNLSLSLGYDAPLSTISLLISFNIAFIVLAIIGYKIKTFEKSFTKNYLPSLNLSTSEKAFLIVPILFPALSIFGMYLMNTTDNNIILMFLLFLIPIYVAFICFFNQKFPERLYPVVIFSISISLLLLLSLRSNHIIGVDTHVAYYLFQIAFDDLHWSVSIIGNQLDACLSISILPTIYQSILNVSSEYLFKILYPLLYSVFPLVIYVISKKYIGEGYAFLAACFFMFQINFLWITANSRTCIAILFFALAMMTLFNDKIENPLKKRILFIVFMASCVVSHYSTTYIFFFVMVGAFIGVEILSKKYTFKKVISLTFVMLFFSMIFFWYSQVTETAFNAGVGFIEETFSNLNKFFVEEMRTEGYKHLAGQELAYPILSRVNLVLTWCTFIFIGIGVFTMIKRYKEMVAISNVKHKKPDFLKDKFEVTYFVIALACSGLLVVMVALPFLSIGYDINRTYCFSITILSVFFVIGGIVLSKNLSLNLLRTVLSKMLRGKKALPKKQKEKENDSQVRAYLIILFVLIPYFLFATGSIHTIFGVPGGIILNSEGRAYDNYYVHDHESYGAKWLIEYKDKGISIYSDKYGHTRLTSQGKIPISSIDAYSLTENRTCEGYIYLRYYNVVNGKLLGKGYVLYNLSEYSHQFVEKNEIYANGGSEVYR
jgi:uncharacterized membrane protein